jgi:anthranilate synthase/aminodeoxychorismate synthase-like glutamine amidotransferase
LIASEVGASAVTSPAGGATVTLLLVDNYDSFTWNLVQRLRELGAGVEVVRNDAVGPGAALARRCGGLVVSPGPGRPEAAGSSPALVRAFADAGRPVLGVCLGLQAIAWVFGAGLERARRPLHGRCSAIHHDGRGVFRTLPSPFAAARYHSLVVSAQGLPDCLEVSARSPEGEVMGLRHRRLPIEGVQFHPESIATREGPALLRNFLETCAAQAGQA